jgi:hypothetical protein
MAIITIPERLKPGFKILLKLPQKRQLELVKYIVDSPIGITPETLVEELPANFEGDPNELKIATSILLSIFNATDSFEFNAEKFIPDFVTALEDSNLAPDSPDEFRFVLKTLLSVKEKIDLSKKLEGLVSEGQRLITNSRIVTDIRPIVHDDDAKNILGLTVIHTLKITFFDGESQRENYFSLDISDIEKLEKNILRAKEKHEAFKNKFASSDFQFFELR